jgi:hypothetical protein
MANGIHTSQKGKMRRHKQKAEQKDLSIVSAKYVQDFIIAITFSNGKTNVVDFLPLFQNHVKGDNLKYFAPINFKKFIVNDGNIYWGKNEDVIFPVSFLRDKDESEFEETLYVI